MKSVKKLFIIFFLLFLFPFSVFAQEKDRIITLPRDEIVNDDYFAAGQTVYISGTVNGDVYAAGGQVLVDGTVNGDLVAAGGVVNVSGKIGEDARIAGGQVIVSGQIGDDLSVAAGTLEIVNEATLSGNLVTGAGSVIIAAPVNGNVRAGAETINILDNISGNVEAATNNLRVVSGAVIAGDLTYYSENQANIEKQATVSGQIERRTSSRINVPQSQDVQNFFRRTTAVFRIISFLSSLLIGILLTYLFPRFVGETASLLGKSPWLSLGIGFLSVVLFPFVFIILALTLVGLPLAFILLFVYLIILYLAKIFISYFIGSFVLQKLGKKTETVWVFVLGLAIYFILASIPFIGPLFSAFATLFGLGALFIEIRNLIKR
ncbi:hypothetical protein C4578_02980 [Candidatus Microgenomates bacterium]|jgi:cytoskeletal protein CcmA (bactofilin family)|nr:MAG: hypothetical protein C4578_02980 [Candidatus Microgenomates bacterium]